MKTLYILSGFNNYYNRMVKLPGDTTEDYPEPIYTLDATNFVPNDGVNAEHVVGTYDYSGEGDYLLVVEAPNNIVQRWFIIDSVRNRQGQYKLTLRRDLIADYYNIVTQSPMFIEKATLTDDNPLIYNSEQMTFNQIKTKETLIKDKTSCPWIVGYYAKNADDKYLEGTINRNLLNDSYDILIDQPFSSWEFNATNKDFYLSPSTFEYCVYGMKNTTSIGFQQQNGYLKFDAFTGKYIAYTYVSNLSASLDFNFNGPAAAAELSQQLIKAGLQNLYNQALTYTNVTSKEDSDYFLNLQGVIVKDSLGAYYQLSIEPTETITTFDNVQSGSLFNSLSTIVNENGIITGTANTQSFKIKTIKQAYKMTAVELYGLESSWDMTGGKLVTEDAPYNIFAIPYGSVTLRKDNQNICTSNKEDSIATANSIIQTMTDNILYDIQLLPYCPLSVESEDGYIDVLSDLSYSLIKSSEEESTNIGFILNIPKARFSKNIYLDEPIIITNKKIQNECDMYKLCSPNWASEFSFNAAKNNGIQFFNIDCEYKPFSPYIHINPNFSGLYGQDFNDARGLILSGDFSLSQFSAPWQSYQIQNKNFQNIFDRQIQNMEVQNKYGRIQDIARAVSGTFTGAASGALAGSVVSPGGIGTAAGAITGGVASAIGGVADIVINEKLRAEAIDYTKDNFGYQLGNIQALPYTLTKVSSFNQNNKIFPVLEYYTCTDVEKEALANKIAYNGMTVMCIDKMINYLENTWSYNDVESKGYIKGQLIRFEDFGEDFHIVNSIAGELNKGIYIR